LLSVRRVTAPLEITVPLYQQQLCWQQVAVEHLLNMAMAAGVVVHLRVTAVAQVLADILAMAVMVAIVIHVVLLAQVVAVVVAQHMARLAVAAVGTAAAVEV
jgi:hypothetical protein